MLIVVVLEVGLFVLAFTTGDFFGKYTKYVFEGLNIAAGSIMWTTQKKDYEAWTAYGQKPKSVLIPVLIALVPTGAFIGLMIWGSTLK